MLPSEELLNKYRAAEKSGTAEPEQTKTEAEKDEKAEPAATEPSNEPQPATEGNDKGQGTTENAPDPEKDERTRYQRDFEKRLHRQERSHQAQMAAIRKEFDEYKKAHELAKPELKPEDFQTRAEFDEYKEKQLVDRIRKQILEEQQTAEEQKKADAESAERVQGRLKQAFGTPERIQQFQTTMNEFIEDESEFMESENGQLFQEFIDERPLGLIVGELIAKSPDAIKGMKNCSPTMLMDKLHRFEDGLAAQIKAMQAKKEEKPTETAKPKPTMPSTGAIGKTTASTGFSAKDWLRQKFPERYGKR